MELEFENGSNKFPMEKGSKIELGRSQLGFPSDDRTVSRRHLSLQLHEPTQKPAEESYPDGEISAYFQVIGRNPIWVLSRDGEKKRVYRKSEKGVLRAGDRFTISLNNPMFFTLKQRDFKVEEDDDDDDDDEKRVLKAVERRRRRTLERKEEEQMRVLKDECSLGDCSVDDVSMDLGLGSLNLSQINPVEEFGFLVMGQEFNQYPEQKIWHVKDWNWFLKELKEDSEDDQADDNGTEKSRTGRKKKKRGEFVHDDDDDWKGESMDDEVLVAKLRNGKRSKYSTRSRDWKNLSKDASSKKSVHQKTISADEDENDDTLGGFIVNDDELEGEEEDSDENDMEEQEGEEEEYDEDDDVDNGEEDTDD